MSDCYAPLPPRPLCQRVWIYAEQRREQQRHPAVEVSSAIIVPIVRNESAPPQLPIWLTAPNSHYTTMALVSVTLDITQRDRVYVTGVTPRCLRDLGHGSSREDKIIWVFMTSSDTWPRPRHLVGDTWPMSHDVWQKSRDPGCIPLQIATVRHSWLQVWCGRESAIERICVVTPSTALRHQLRYVIGCVMTGHYGN